MDIEFLTVSLGAAQTVARRLDEFYRNRLGFSRATTNGGLARSQIGRTTLEFHIADGDPFYHFALLVPGNRFAAAAAWAAERVSLLADPDTGKRTFDFDFWKAQACYFHDPAGNIVELIAHQGVDESSARGSFSSSEITGLSELGLVVDDKAAAAGALHEELGLPVWDGAVDEAGLAFVGVKARTLILTPPERGWLPTGRPAQSAPAHAELVSPRRGIAELADGLYRLASSSAG